MLGFHITNQIQEQGGLEQNKKLSDIRGPYSIEQHEHLIKPRFLVALTQIVSITNYYIVVVHGFNISIKR